MLLRRSPSADLRLARCLGQSGAVGQGEGSVGEELRVAVGAAASTSDDQAAQPARGALSSPDRGARDANPVNPDLVRAVIQAESAFNPRARVPQGRDGADAADAGDRGGPTACATPSIPPEHPRRREIPEAAARPLRRPGRARARRLQRRPGCGEEVRRQGAALPRDAELRRPDPAATRRRRHAGGVAARPHAASIGRSRSSTAAKSSGIPAPARGRRAVRPPSAADAAPLTSSLPSVFRMRRRSRLSGVDRARRVNARASRVIPPHLDLLLGRLRGPVLVERAGLGLGDVPVGESWTTTVCLRPSGREMTISSPGRISRWGFAGWPLTSTRPILQAFWASDRVRKRQAMSSQTSSR